MCNISLLHNLPVTWELSRAFQFSQTQTYSLCQVRSLLFLNCLHPLSLLLINPLARYTPLSLSIHNLLSILLLIGPHIAVSVSLFLGFVTITIRPMLQAILHIKLLGHVSHKRADRGVSGSSAVTCESRTVATRAATESVPSSRTAHVDLLQAVEQELVKGGCEIRCVNE